ncbi:Putative transport protein YdiK [Buchnera aphidicola (Thelaxes suberi)]|uniref:AI-2E family transporter YdiK n=1 Tax=Buchnera aphidicola TaxID=9 RepID=UPI003463F8D6
MKIYHMQSDFTKIFFSVFFTIIIVTTSFWVIRPFIIGFIWSSMIVVATWPFLKKIRFKLNNQKIVSVSIMFVILLLSLLTPVIFLFNVVINSTFPLLQLFRNKLIGFPDFFYLKEIPIIGIKLFNYYQKIIHSNNLGTFSFIKPCIKNTTELFLSNAGYFSNFFMHLIFILIFSTFLYWNGSKISNIINSFVYRLGSPQIGETLIILMIHAIRAVVVGVLLTALVQSILSGIILFLSGISYSSLIMLLIFFFCLIQMGPLPILIPITIWFYLNEEFMWGTIILGWSCIICAVDNFLRPRIIKIGADLPTSIVLSGMIGGLLAFGFIGIFIGPVILYISYRLIFSWIYKKQDVYLSLNNVPIKLLEKK